ncbi:MULTISPECIES: hypothetical protein [Sphingobium]|uniref:Uncharacterized protein n=1 Tax=Sphingobium indicum (strain DSM 16413 / CCM 7287 / MTCC 6362 / UT26 / NBRC 101211 / UT26S) TaxID=452662 RepID=D4Z4M1_SPHIU|nr:MULTISPECIES: hypothetical protein [Sphingobium]EPR08211.1 hypothetical protein M527_10215 [Sphingobium indicum IP26]EQB06366.1 hypothetical protein L286_06730 [Sphingobium sp. HDIP04]NYI22090.1 hypothetical protein [Sphingobium indicum]BAI97553.1 hypothetical protein SJA_C1-27190 [Sphingobium indicum UT26S]
MTRRRSRRGGTGPSRRPPWWFMPAVMAGLGAAGALLSAAMLTVAE